MNSLSQRTTMIDSI